MSKRKTLKDSFSISGIGLHTGEKVDLICKPSMEKHGIYFKRTDIADSELVLADVKNVFSTIRSTSLQSGNSEVHTVEHLLSALAAKNIQDAIVELNGPELPILDGSSNQILAEINGVGVIEKEENLEVLVLDEPLEFFHEGSGAKYTLLPADKLQITVCIDFENTSIGKQYATLDDLESYEKEISKAKTFVVLKDLEQLVKNDLAKGGSLENAVVFTNGQGADQIQKMAKIFGLSDQEISIENGLIKGQKLNYSNEPARHKLLDLIGDLSLVGRPIQAKIIAEKPGHASNVELAKILKKRFNKLRKLKGKPKYDPSITPVYNQQQLKGILPHRFPFLMVDRVIELSDSHVVGIKNVTINEDLFNGHFPGNPVFPGVMQMEALAQTGGVLAMSTVENPKEWDSYFMKMDHVKFKNIVRPGDTMILKMELMSPIRRGICQMRGTVYVGDKIVSEGELTAQLVKRT